MKIPQIRYTVILMLFYTLGVAQTEIVSPGTFMDEHYQINRNGMLVLGSWAIGNMALSGISVGLKNGRSKAFHQMNIGWNAVNAVIAGIGYYSSNNDPSAISLLGALHEHEQMKQLLLFNAGLDIAYMAGGFYLKERAKNKTEKQEQLNGFGNSILMNGAFLFGFDLIMYLIHNNHGNNNIYNTLSHISISSESVGLIVNF